MVEWQIASGSSGITIGGSTGEPSAQSVEERAAAIRATAEAIGDRVPFMAGTGTAKLQETLELTAGRRRRGRGRVDDHHALLLPADAGSPVPLVRAPSPPSSRTCRS